MLSESCAPLYPPGVVYQQLMYERSSRINACDSDPNYYRDNYRYLPPSCVPLCLSWHACRVFADAEGKGCLSVSPALYL